MNEITQLTYKEKLKRLQEYTPPPRAEDGIYVNERVTDPEDLRILLELKKQHEQYIREKK